MIFKFPRSSFNCRAVIGILSLLFAPIFPLFAVQENVVDVCVYGGTSGGVIAAVQAARMGKTVALVGVNNHLGGMTSGGLGQTDVGSFGNGYIQGVAREFYARVGAKYGAGAKFTFEPHVAESVFKEMVQQAGLTVFTNQYLTAVTKQGKQIIAATMSNGNVFRAKMFIDASYEGDLMAAAGISYTVGRESTGQYGESLNGIRPPNAGGHQFGSLTVNPYLVTNNSTSGLIPLIQTNVAGTPGAADQSVQAYNFRICLTTTVSNQLPITAPVNYNPAQYELLARYIQAMINNGGSPSLATFMNIGSMPNSKTDINNNGAASTDFIGQSAAYVSADYSTRQQIWQAHKDYLQGFLYFLGHDLRVPSNVRSSMLSYGLCKDEFADNGGWPYQLYVREARRMVSDYVMTQSNCLRQITVTDSVGMAAYVMDSHNNRRIVVNGLVQNEGDTYGLTSIPGTYPIAYRSIIPKASEGSNLLVPWCLSASHIAFGSIRMEPVFMILSQSAATAACFALDQQTNVQNINIAKLQAQLASDGQALSMSTTSGTAEIADNSDTSSISIVGTWTSSTASAGYYGSDYLHDGNTNKGVSSVTFTPSLPQGRSYQVFVRWTSNANRATNAPIDIIHPGGTNTIFVDQTQQGGQWVWLMTTNFNAGAGGSVRIRNAGTKGYVIADAIEFVSGTSIVQLWATDSEASRYGPTTASFTVSRTGNTNMPDTVNLNFAGTATNGADYLMLNSSVTLPAGVFSTNIKVFPFVSSMPVGDKNAVITLVPNSAYNIGDISSATIKIKDIPFNSWKLQRFGTDVTNAFIAGDNAAPAGDGVPNIAKYALGFNPATYVSNSVINPWVIANQFNFSYTRPDPAPEDIEYQMQVSDDLVNWNTNSAKIQQIAYNTNQTANIMAHLTVPINQTNQKFVRLKISRKTLSKPIQDATVVAFGDSITLGYGLSAAQMWTSQLASRFNLNLINAGVSGNTSSQGLARMDTDVLAKRPDFVIINFGMNDHVMDSLDNPKVSQSMFQTNLITMIDRVRSIGAIPVLIAVSYIIEGDASQYYYNRHPSSYYSNVGGAQAWLDTYIQIVRNVAVAKTVDLIDVRSGCNSYSRYDFLRSLDNGAATDDGVHPYITGANIYAQLIGEHLAEHY